MDSDIAPTTNSLSPIMIASRAYWPQNFVGSINVGSDVIRDANYRRARVGLTSGDLVEVAFLQKCLKRHSLMHSDLLLHHHFPFIGCAPTPSVGRSDSGDAVGFEMFFSFFLFSFFFCPVRGETRGIIRKIIFCPTMHLLAIFVLVVGEDSNISWCPPRGARLPFFFLWLSDSISSAIPYIHYPHVSFTG